MLQAAIRKRAPANKKSCHTRKSAVGPAPGGLCQPQAGGHPRRATTASYKPEVQSERGLCQPQARVISRAYRHRPSGARSAGPAATAFMSRVTLSAGPAATAFRSKVSRACRHSLLVQGQPGMPPQAFRSGGLCQPQAGGHLRWAIPASYKPEVQSGRGLCQPQARVRSGGLCQPQAWGSVGAGITTSPGFV